jgi:mRNA interferase RelE/StbE
MTYRIEIKRTARKALLALPHDVQRRLSESIDALASDPHGTSTRKLTGSDTLYRVRIGDYRVVYEVQDDRLLIHVVKVGHRRDIYR